MPSRNTYGLVNKDLDQSCRLLDVEDPQDKQSIIQAIQACRIVLRALEITGFRVLQKDLNKLTKRWTPQENEQLVQQFAQLPHQLAQLLTSLRWRISWWKYVGDLSINNQELGLKEKFTERVTMLARVLYHYLSIARKKLPNSTAIEASHGDFAKNINAGTLIQNFPESGELRSFNAWMAQGETLIRDAQEQQRSSSQW